METDVSSRRVSCAHARSWRFSRSESHSWGDRVCFMSTNSMDFVGLTLCLTFLATWGRGCQPRGTASFGTDFVVLAFYLLLAAFAYLWASMAGSSVIWFGCGSGLEYARLLNDVVPKVTNALLFCRKSRPFSFNPRRSTDNTTSLVALRRPLCMRRLRFFHCGCPRRCSTFGALGFSMHRKGQPDYRQNTGVRLCIGGACSRGFGRAGTARDIWGQRTSRRLP